MAKLKNYNGRYCESEYESAFIAFLQSVGWTYLPGNKIKRCYRDVLIADDFRAFITKANTDLLEEEIEQIYDTVRLVGAESDFATLHKVYKWMVDGIQFTPQSGLPIQVMAMVDAIHEDDSNALKEKFHLLSNDEKISVNAKENLISWYKENIPIPFDENTDDNKELTHLYDSNMAGYKEVFLQCMDSYREASMVELGNLDNAYGNLDFIIANKCIRQKAYEQIYDKLRKIVYQFRNEVYHFNLLKDGNGNFPVCILKVSELNQKYFLSKEKNLQGYTNVSIFQNVFDDIDASLEKFRCKIYRIEYVEPKAIPVSGKTFFNNNEK